MSKEKIWAHAALWLTALIFGLNYWISKSLTGKIDVNALVVMRSVGAAIIFWALWPMERKKESIQIKDLWRLALAGLLGIAVNQIFFFSGLKLSNPVDTSIIHVSNPIIVLLLSIGFLKAKFTYVKAFGILLGASGALLLILYSSNIEFNSNNLKGNLFILINTAAYACYLVLIKPVLQKYSTMTVLRWVYLFGSLSVLLYSFIIDVEIPWQQFDLESLASLFYIIVVVTFFAYLLSAYGLKRLSPTTVSYYIYLQPLFAAIISFVLGVQALGWYQLLAASLIFSGVYFVSKT